MFCYRVNDIIDMLIPNMNDFNLNNYCIHTYKELPFFYIQVLTNPKY